MGTLKATVTGICAFTPGTAGTGKLRVIMPASLRRMTTSTHASAQPPTLIPVHVPFLATTAELMPVKPDRPFDMRVSVDGNPDHDRLIWLLQREYVTLSADASDVIDLVDGSVSNPKKPTTVTEQHYIRWVADMRDVWPDRSQIRSDCITTTTPAADVAAHIEFNGGKVTTLVVGTRDKDIATFVPTKVATVEKTLARAIQVELPFAGSSMTVRFRSLDGGADLGSLRLDGTDINIMVGNVTLQDVHDLQIDIFGGTVQEGRDHHFELYYDILAVDAAANTELPAPILPPQGVHQNCPPLRTV